ncbi:MAG: pyridoxamine 5'-phosphate oxidase family protein [Thermodesulfobacteriota bacterium]|jgi:nitroimidazol reductase NimA-like FMN-containing flavoprotein (pyridoxamine 5'-phosphate oxidase superfamily)
MRRKEFEVKEREPINEVLKTAEIGYLSFNGPDGWPRVTPLNFVYDGRILWHGAIAGERFDCLKHDPRATFVAVSAQLYLPSHLLSEENATAATAAFKSALVRGRCQAIEDPEEKCSILNRLMEKYQPEGRFKEISPKDPMYEKVLRATGVYALTAEEVSGKFKFCQNKSKEDRQKIVAKLKNRGLPVDLMFSEEIRKTIK